MTTYPDVRPVPISIPRPSYVPSNFFDVGWGYHLPGKEEVDTPGTGISDSIAVERIRKVGRLVGEVLKEVGKLVKVQCFIWL
jgi:methionyl aminopeptidase